MKKILIVLSILLFVGPRIYSQNINTDYSKWFIQLNTQQADEITLLMDQQNKDRKVHTDAKPDRDSSYFDQWQKEEVVMQQKQRANIQLMKDRHKEERAFCNMLIAEINAKKKENALILKTYKNTDLRDKRAIEKQKQVEADRVKREDEKIYTGKAYEKFKKSQAKGWEAFLQQQDAAYQQKETDLNEELNNFIAENLSKLNARLLELYDDPKFKFKE